MGWRRTGASPAEVGYGGNWGDSESWLARKLEIGCTTYDLRHNNDLNDEEVKERMDHVKKSMIGLDMMSAFDWDYIEVLSGTTWEDDDQSVIQGCGAWLGKIVVGNWQISGWFWKGSSWLGKVRLPGDPRACRVEGAEGSKDNFNLMWEQTGLRVFVNARSGTESVLKAEYIIEGEDHVGEVSCTETVLSYSDQDFLTVELQTWSKRF